MLSYVNQDWEEEITLQWWGGVPADLERGGLHGECGRGERFFLGLWLLAAAVRPGGALVELAMERAQALLVLWACKRGIEGESERTVCMIGSTRCAAI